MAEAVWRTRECAGRGGDAERCVAHDHRRTAARFSFRAGGSRPNSGRTISTDKNCAKQRGCHNYLALRDSRTGSRSIGSGRVTTIALQLEKQYPDSNTDRPRGNVLPLSDVIVGEIRPILLALLGGAALLLLIASMNVASLLLVRSESRRREIAVRGALGASRLRLLRQFVTEGVVLAAAGSVLGLTGAYGAMRSLAKLHPHGHDGEYAVSARAWTATSMSSSSRW